MRFIPKSGIAFILISVFNFLLWAGGKGNMPFVLVVIVEVIAFIICFLGANIESKRK